MAEAICKRCIHHDICDSYSGEEIITFFPYNEDCKHFKDKADVTERRHGHWIDTDRFDSFKTPIYQCSECWKEVADNYIKYHKFCLHCGAPMMEVGNSE